MTNEIYNKMVDDYQSGVSFEELQEQYGYDSKYIKEVFKRAGIYNPRSYTKFTSDELELIANFPKDGNIDELAGLIPNHTKESIELKIKRAESKDIKDSDPIGYMKNLISDKPYKMMEETFNPTNMTFSAITEDGYKVFIRKTTLSHKKIPDYFSTRNPHTIENIDNFIRLNNLNVQLLTREYSGQNTIMEWKCKCGNIFQASWKMFLRGKRSCDECVKKKVHDNQTLDKNEIESTLKGYGYLLIKWDESIPVSKQKIDVEDDQGYKYQIYWGHLMCGNDKPWRFGPTNEYTIENINRFLFLAGESDISCISTDYINHEEPLDFLYTPTGDTFKMSLTEVQCGFEYTDATRNGHHIVESLHASIMKQVFCHEYPDTIPEERSCINPKTRFALPTDIVNHRLKIAIEIQSGFHDKEYQKEKDEIKKQFWIDKGYSFYALDIRDYTILEMLQVFFPEMEHIPDYVDYGISHNEHVKMVQDGVEKYMTAQEISDNTGINIVEVQDLIRGTRIVLPDGYNELINQKERVVRLDIDGNYLTTYDSISDACEKEGYSRSGLYTALHKDGATSHDSVWIFQDKFLQNDVV